MEAGGLLSRALPSVPRVRTRLDAPATGSPPHFNKKVRPPLRQARLVAFREGPAETSPGLRGLRLIPLPLPSPAAPPVKRPENGRVERPIIIFMFCDVHL